MAFHSSFLNYSSFKCILCTHIFHLSMKSRLLVLKDIYPPRAIHWNWLSPHSKPNILTYTKNFPIHTMKKGKTGLLNFTKLGYLFFFFQTHSYIMMKMFLYIITLTLQHISDRMHNGLIIACLMTCLMSWVCLILTRILVYLKNLIQASFTS